MVEKKCANCRHLQHKPCTKYDYCPVIDEQVDTSYDDIYTLCCDCWEEDI